MIEIAEGVLLAVAVGYGAWALGALLFYGFADLYLFRTAKGVMPPAQFAQLCHDAAVSWPRSITMVAVMTFWEVARAIGRRLP